MDNRRFNQRGQGGQRPAGHQSPESTSPMHSSHDGKNAPGRITCTPLPKSVNDLACELINSKRFQNSGLLMQKYSACRIKTGENELSSLEGKGKREFLQILVNQQSDRLVQIVEHSFSRWCEMLGGLGSDWHTEKFSAKTRWRMVVGLGSGSVLETAMTMHPVYGFPYIPGSSLKGLTRAWAEAESGVNKKLIDDIFGPAESQDASQGKVIFFDAMPKKLPELEIDIINPHYKDYYEDKAPPANWLSPNPVYFLAIAPGAHFHFAVASKQKELADRAIAWLKAGLDKYGIGSKTLVGYGHFDVPQSDKSG